MLLLDRVLEHALDRTVCRVDVEASELFRGCDGSVPAWVGLEYMAQCAAVHGALAARARGRTPGPGLFLGSRRARFRAEAFEPHQVLRVSARHHRGESGLVAFDCEIRDEAGGAALAEARVNVYTVDAWSDLLEAVT
jgi:predicted hotdog family 3-hydroxylacyl-ACP dehydratase